MLVLELAVVPSVAVSPQFIPRRFSSTLAAGVSGGSALRFAGMTGVTGESSGSAATCVDGVDKGVAAVEFVSGSEWWCAMDCSWSVCCCVWCAGRISSNTTIVQ